MDAVAAFGGYLRNQLAGLTLAENQYSHRASLEHLPR
jgi:hypothetical protein